MRVTRRVGVWRPGVTRGPDLFPFKDIAEQYARLAALNPPGRFLMHFAGAYPKGDAAPGSCEAARACIPALAHT